MSGVTIVIPSWNGIRLLKEFLPAVLRAADNFCQLDDQCAEILIVDDGSNDGTSEWLTSQGFHELDTKAVALTTTGGYGQPSKGREDSEESEVSPASSRSASTVESTATMESKRIHLSFVSNTINRGFSVSCNAGIRMARYPLIFLLNNDVEPAADSISVLRSNFSASSVFAVHCRVFNSETGKQVGTGKLCSFSRGFLRVHRSYVPRPDAPGPNGPIPKFYSAFAGGGASMFDREKFIELGGFDELFSPFYWEDVEISYRSWKRGYTILYEPRAVANHRISSTIGKLPEASVKRIQQRNRIILHWIHLHDSRMVKSHILWLVLLTATAPIRLQPGFVASVASAFARLREIRKRRAREKFLARRTDRAVIGIFDQLSRNQLIVPYDGKLD
jgi:GT2 family glycosyltransferase